MQPRIGTLLGLLSVLVLLVYYTVRLEKYDDPRLYYEVAGQALGRPADEAYLRMKRDNTPLTAPLAVSAVPAGQRRLPYRDFAVEYPPLALGVFVLPRLLTDSVDRYMHIMQAMMGGAILVTTFALARMLRRLHPEVQDPTRLALLLAALTVGLAGSYMVRRFDVLLSASIAVAILSMIAGSPFTAGLFLGAGAAMKLWPVMLLPLLLMYDRRSGVSWRLVLGFAVLPVLSHLVLFPAVGGSVLSYLGFHAGRGLQLESLWSSILMFLGKAFHLPADVGFDHGSANLVMPRFVPAVMPVSYVLMLGSVVACYVVGYRAFRRSLRRERPRHLVEASVMLIACLMITAKVFSPQYLSWLFPLALVLPDRGIAVLYLAALGITHLYFPYRYDDLTEMTWRGVSILLTRNLVVVALAAAAFRVLIRGYGSAYRRPARPELAPAELG